MKMRLILPVAVVVLGVFGPGLVCNEDAPLVRPDGKPWGRDTRLAHDLKRDMIVAGASAYSRFLDFEKFAAIAKSVGAYLMVIRYKHCSSLSKKWSPGLHRQH